MRVRRAALILILGASAAACTSSSPQPHGSGIHVITATPAALLPTSADALPDTTFTDLQRLLSQLRGTPVVLNVWGSWCGPCREEGPRLAAAARRYGHRVQFLGLDVKDSVTAAATFVARMRWPYPSLFDPTPNADVERQLGYFAQPVTLFYARGGKIVEQVSGPVTTSALDDGIRRILA